ncbi:MAG: hypothetical protein ACE5R6_16775 [Candidatus Heimdallarchaeota archaeon]
MKNMQKKIDRLEQKKNLKISKKTERRNREWKRKRRRAIMAYEERINK